MFNILIILIAAVAFLAGYRLGSLTKPKVKSKNRKSGDDSVFLKEYENFLNYDGDEQS